MFSLYRLFVRYWYGLFVGQAEQVQALYNFEAEEEGELSFGKGTILTVLEKPDPNWWMGVDGNGSRGLIPSTYVKAIWGDGHHPTLSISIRTKLAKHQSLPYRRRLEEPRLTPRSSNPCEPSLGTLFSSITHITGPQSDDHRLQPHSGGSMYALLILLH